MGLHDLWGVNVLCHGLGMGTNVYMCQSYKIEKPQQNGEAISLKAAY